MYARAAAKGLTLDTLTARCALRNRGRALMTLSTAVYLVYYLDTLSIDIVTARCEVLRKATGLTPSFRTAVHGYSSTTTTPRWPFCSRGPRPLREFEGGRQSNSSFSATTCVWEREPPKGEPATRLAVLTVELYALCPP